MSRRGEQRDARSARAADDDRGSQVEGLQQTGEVIGLHLRFGSAGEADVDAPVLARSQIRTRCPCAARASASSRTPGASLVKRPPGVTTHGAPSPMISYAIVVPSISIVGMWLLPVGEVESG